MTTYIRREVLLALVLGSLSILFAGIPKAEASHAWGTYHWARPSNPITISLGDNVASQWDSYLVTSSQDWSIDPSVVYPGSGASKVVSTTIIPGSAGKNCKAVSGTVQVCSKTYGRTGWLGIAQIWVDGTHITAGTVKMNDTYYNTVTYNTPAWRNLVMCQEIGHTFGLGHQDEAYTNANLGTCMDYTNSPASNQHPNLHDYEQLASIYGHVDTFTTALSSFIAPVARRFAEDSDDPSTWGREVSTSRDGRLSVYELDLGNGQKTLRHVFWAQGQDIPRRLAGDHHE